MRLYELTNTYAALMQQLEDADNPVAREKIMQAICDVQDSVSEKAEACARIIKNEEADIVSLTAEIRRLQDMKRVKENTVRRMKDNVQYALHIAGAQSIETSIGKWRVQMNPPEVDVVDIRKVPARFLIEQEPAVDKRAMLEEFRITGEEFEGVTITQSEGVRFQ